MYKFIAIYFELTLKRYFICETVFDEEMYGMDTNLVTYNIPGGYDTIEEAFDAVVKHELKISQVEGGVVI